MFILCSVLQVALSQDDLKMLLRILMENLGEAGGPHPGASRQEAAVQLQAARDPLSGVRNLWRFHCGTSRST